MLDKDDEDEVEAARAGAEGPIKVKRTRATIRISPNNIIIANGLRGDVFKSSAESCQGWYYGTITRQGTGAKHTGWVQGPGLTRSPKSTKSNCSRAFPYTTRIGFINAPFHSITFRTSKRKWTKTGSASQAYLTPGCTLYMNYDAAHGAADPVTGATERLVFKNGDASAKNGIIGYRYTSPDGKYALVSVKSGFKKGKRDIGLWAYASRSCVVPLSARGKSKANRIYFTEIRICDGVRPTEAAKRMNRAPRSKRIRQVKPCRLPNGKSKPGKNVADSLANGWRVGRLRTPR